MDDLIGLSAGNFRISRLIGRGGMSSVYLAIDEDLEREVALKVPHSRFLDNHTFVKRFRREAKAMARLRHPNIVQIYSVGNHGELPFFAMEYIRGDCLEKIIKRKGPIKLGVALDYISQLARAMEYAHGKGVIHRDIKPANILLDPSGRLLVTDFGVSKMLSEVATQETAGFVGTPQYMSPEQCGQGTLDHRTDIYSMGAVLFEMLTGKAAFSSESPAEAIKKQLFDMPEFPREFEEKIPEKVRAVISKMLAKDPAKRYPDIRSFLRDLKRLDEEFNESTVAGATIRIAPPKASRKKRAASPRARKKGSRRAAVVFACLLVACAGALMVAFKWNGGNGPDIGLMASIFSGDAAPLIPPPEQTIPSAAEQSTLDPAPNMRLQAEPEPVNIIPNNREAEIAPGPQWASAVINSKPSGAEVFLDSQPQGTTPLALPRVAPGGHTLAVRLEGYPDYSKEISADAQIPFELFHDFEAAKKALTPMGSLVIDSEPSGAVVYLNGKKKGTTRMEMPDARAADYTIELVLDGYEPLQKKVTLLPDESLRISLNMVEKPKFGGLRIRSNPEGADVLLGGVKKGVTPLVLHRLPVGEYEIALRKRGYRPYRQAVMCEEGSTGIVEASLEMTPRFAAAQSVAAGDRHAKRGDLARAAAAYDRAMALDPESPQYRNKLKHIKRSILKKEVLHLISSYELAYDSENAELLASLLDESEADFATDQVKNAESLFREFDNIDMAISEPRLSLKGPGEMAVELHFSINADFAETGVSAELLNANQTLTLRHNPETGWKICAIE